MISMRWIVLAVGLMVSACGGAAEPTTTTAASVDTTRATILVTTTTPTQPMVVQNCVTPPVMFVPLCEMWELLEEWHVDRPLDPAVLADLAIEGLDRFEPDESADPPRALTCAIPDNAFLPYCEALGEALVIRNVPLEDAVEASMAHMVDVGLGPFTYYVSPEQRDAFRANGVVGGVGVLLDSRDPVGSKCARLGGACVLEVVTVLEDNPGFRAGLRSGDLITEVDGVPVDGQGFSTVVGLIAGDESGLVGLTVERSGEIVEFEIERAPLVFPTVETLTVRSGVGYIRIPDFDWDIPTLVSEGLAQLGSPNTLVVDLRGNPGGFVDAVVSVSDLFISGGTVLITESPNDDRDYTAQPGGPGTSSRLVVLVDNGTASAAEILTGALRDRRNAVVVGTNTFGKDAVQIPFRLRNDGEFYVVVARWSSPAGETAEGDGLSPDVQLDWPADASIEEIVNLALEASS